MRLLKAILAVVLVVAILVIAVNGKNGETIGGEDPNARPAAGDTISSTDTVPPADTLTSSVRTWPAWSESASVKLGEELKLSCPVLVYCSPEEVWDALTTVRRFFMWYPHWEREENMMRRLGAVGDTVAFHLDGAIVGRSTVTTLEPMKELKIVHALKDGTWAGSIMISLSPADRGVGLNYEELMPPSGRDVEGERRRVCKQVMLIKRLAEGE